MCDSYSENSSSSSTHALWREASLPFDVVLPGFDTPKPNRRIGWKWRSAKPLCLSKHSTLCISCFARGSISSLARRIWSTIMLRVICLKSKNLTFSVNVRPRILHL